jgi:integrase
MTFAAAATRWWHERGKHRKDFRNVERHLAWLQTHIGTKTMLRAVDNNLVARLVSLRRQDAVGPATVNRGVVQILRAIVKRAQVWEQPVARVAWGDHTLKEPQELVREMTAAEEATLFKALRVDLHPIARFMIITGLRRAEACHLKWADVDLVGARMIVRGKGDTIERMPIPDVALTLLQQEVGNHPEFVFTLINGPGSSHHDGARRPILPSTLGVMFWRTRKVTGLHDLRLHDLRHTAATRTLRATGNLGVVQKMLRHKRINTTMRYAHVTEDDLRSAMNRTNPVEDKIHAKFTQEDEKVV